MGTQFHLPANQAGAQEINSVVAIVCRQERVAYFASGIPVFIHKQDDRAGQRVATAELLELGLATQQERYRRISASIPRGGAGCCRPLPRIPLGIHVAQGAKLLADLVAHRLGLQRL